jgi:hypothetical protein
MLTALTVATAAASTSTSPTAKASERAWHGSASTAPRTFAPGFLLDRRRYKAFDAPDARLSTAPAGINNYGQIVGYYDDGDSEQAFMRDRDGRFRTIKIPGAQSARALDINNRGRGFLLRRGVKGPFTPIDFPGAPRTVASGINDRGQAVGFYENPNARTFRAPSPLGLSR